jgi:hypothetical protein
MTMNYKSLIKTTTGDLVILGVKDTCKTTLLMHIARELRQDAKNHVYIMETFPKWIHEFDNIPYMTIKEQDVEPKENLAYLEENSSIIQWSKDYTILNANEVVQFLKTNKDGIFLIECSDKWRFSPFTYISGRG